VELIDLICLIAPSTGCRAASRDLERPLALFPMFGQRIVMYEPTMGLSPLYVDRVLELIQTVNKQGVSTLWSSEIAHEAYVLQTGRIVLSDRRGS
jgi:ABC-type branched-subunit amino acid transport system ATPase component